MTIVRKIGNLKRVRVQVLLVLGLMFLFGCNQTDPYVLVPDRTTDLTPGNPVQIEDVVVGKVEEVRLSEHFPGNQLIRISVDRGYSIPANSRVSIVRNDQDPGNVLQIVVIASKSYLNPGDTVFFKLPEPVQPRTDPVQPPPSGLEYRIQVYASGVPKSIDSPVFKGVEGVEETFDGSLYRYYTGKAKTLAEAKVLHQKIVAKGIGDAFIVAFMNGQRISLEQAGQYEN